MFTAEREMRAAFAVFDADNSGTITQAELTAILTRPVPQGTMLTAEQAAQVFRKCDLNSDGVIDYGEFSKALAAGQLSAPARRGVHAGVRLGWLKHFVKQVPPGMSTLDVVLKIIKPATKERLCRYVLLAEEESPGAVGTAKIFASHTWRAPFRDLVAALAHVADDKDYVWIDVRRRPARRRRAALPRAALQRAAVARRSSPCCSGSSRTASRRSRRPRSSRTSTLLRW